MNISSVLAASLTVFFAGCAADHTQYDSWTNRWGRPYSGPVVEPQVAYRIDDSRFFEVVPLEYFACARARLYYTDIAKGIHTNVASWDKTSDGTFIIDAANDRYLVAPIILSSSGCHAGGGDLCSPSLFFSQDSGKTWIRDVARSSGHVTYLTGDSLYHQLPQNNKSAGEKASLGIAIPEGPRSVVLPGGALERFQILKWINFTSEKIPLPIKDPIDTRLHCKRNEKG